MDASRAWLYEAKPASSDLAFPSPRMSTSTAKMTPDAIGHRFVPMRDTNISRKMPGKAQLHEPP